MISIQKKKSTLFNGFVELVEGGRRSVHILYGLQLKRRVQGFSKRAIMLQLRGWRLCITGAQLVDHVNQVQRLPTNWFI